MVVNIIGKGSREIDTTEAISCTARLAGSFLFRSFEFKINDAKAGTIMLSEQANTKGPQLVNITHSVLQNFGIQIDNNKMSNGNKKQALSNFVDVIGKVQKAQLENDQLTMGLQIISNITDYNDKADKFKKVFGTCCDVAQSGCGCNDTTPKEVGTGGGPVGI